MGAYLDYYLTNMRIAVSQQFQYRAGNYFYMIGMMTEPVIYLVVWSTIARSHGGSVAGFTPGKLAAYYIVWTLVRNINIVFTPFGWDQRIQYGEFSAMLLRPIHPLHHDLSYFAGWKVVVVVLWLPIAVLLSLAFHPVLHPTVLKVSTFALALVGAYLIRSLLLWILGLVTFWTTRVSALYQLVFAGELLFSGRLVPLSFLPASARQAANFMPFQWTFQFPILALVGDMSWRQLLGGLGVQVLWIAGLALVIRVMWPAAVRRYSAVGN